MIVCEQNIYRWRHWLILKKDIIFLHDKFLYYFFTFKVMSTTLLTADNISVKGHHYKVETYGHLPNNSQPYIESGIPHTSDTEVTLSDAVHLDFTLLINGKLKTFGWSFIVEKPAWSDSSDWDWSLAQYSDWNAIYFMLDSLGYGFDENKYWFGQGSVKKWINQVMN